MAKLVIEVLQQAEQVESGDMTMIEAETLARVRSRGSVNRSMALVMVGDGLGAVHTIYFNGLKYAPNFTAD